MGIINERSTPVIPDVIFNSCLFFVQGDLLSSPDFCRASVGLEPVHRSLGLDQSR